MTGGRRVYGDFDPAWTTRFQVASRILAVLSIAAAALALIGRYLGITLLASWARNPDIRPMQVLTAISLVLVAIAVLSSLAGSARRWLGHLGRAAALIALVVGVVVLIERTGLIRVPWPSWVTASVQVEDVAAGERAGVPTTNVGVAVVALAVAMLLVTSMRSSFRLLGQVIAIGAGMVAALVMVAFAYGDTSLAGFPFGGGRMPVSSAGVVLMLATAAVLAQPASGLVAPLASPWAGGILIRRALPFLLILPPVAVALMLIEIQASSRPRVLAWLAVLAAALLGSGLFATAAAINRAGQSLEVARDLTDRARVAVEDTAVLAAGLREMLVRIDPDPAEGIDVAVRFRPAEGWVAGDAVAVKSLGGSRVAVVMVDAAGHGADPSLVAFRLSELILHSLVAGRSPARALEDVRWAFEGQREMATAVVLEVDGTTGACRFVIAGHPPPLLRTRDGRVSRLETTGPLFFAEVTGEWRESLVGLEPGASLVVYTDGLADPHARGRQDLATVDDLALSLQRFPSADAEELADWCLSEAAGRSGGNLRDDAALIVIRRR